MRILILLTMVFLHIVDDYILQGKLASLKQKQWWKENSPEDKYNKYKNDYIIALIEHAFEWSFMIHIPLLIYIYKLVNSSTGITSSIDYNIYYTILAISIIINTVIHSIVDDLKANKFKINLIQDQLAHLVQIIITWLICML